MNEGDGVVATRPSCSEPNGGPDETALFSGFVASASPTSAATGTRYFWTNTLGTIYFDVTDTLTGRQSTCRPQAPGVATAAPIQ